MLMILLKALGYLAGWYLARLYRFDLTHRITLAIEIGMQNAGMGGHSGAAGASAYFRRKQTLVKT